MMYAKVIVDITHSNVDRIFEYKIRDDMQIALGHRVLVPFGMSDKVIEGFVIAVSDKVSYDVTKLKEISQRLDEYPVLLQSQIDLAYYMREKYGCTVAEAIRLMLPGRLHGLREKTRNVAEIISNDISCLYTKSGKPKAKKQIQVYDCLKAKGKAFVFQLEKEINGSSNALKALEEKGIVKITPMEIQRKPYKNINKETKKILLNDQQQNAVDKISENMYSGRKFLLHGVTGSGKTEVYLRLVKKAVDDGKGAIILVPEISLTPQAVERYRNRFGDKVALLHSRLSQGERFDEWKRILTGECTVVLGPRSAIFAPVKNLAVVIVDEEHEGTYQSDSFPRYNAKELAEYHISSTGTVVFGSATPGIDSYFRQQQGELMLIEMDKRANNMPLPETNVVDMIQEMSDGNRSIISNFLYEKINDRLNRNEQVILLLNKRGYASFVMCRGCGYVMKCPHCDVSLAYHKHDGSRVKCHYCGFEANVSKICPECSKPYMKHFGIGTQQVEEYINSIFPKAKTLRMDFDTTRHKDAHYNIFNQFINKQADILIGTQMIAKGLDFPGVTLVGIVCADNMFNLPDYRAKERAFALITQASGRAGRDKTKGEVVIQTYLKNNPTLAYAIRQDYKGFYGYEIALREKTEYPPFSIFYRVVVQSQNNDNAFETAKELNKIIFEKLNREAPKEKIIYSCGPCPISFLKDMHRYQILMKLKTNENSAEFIKSTSKMLKEFSTEKNVYIDYEINSKSML